MKTAPRFRSYVGTVKALPGFLLNGGVKETRSCRFRMKRDAEAWVSATMSQPFAGTGQVFGSKKAPELNALS